MGLSAARDTRQLGVGDNKAMLSELAIPQKANTKIYPGALVVVNAGYAAPGTAATGLLAAGCADQDNPNQVSDSTGLADGAISVRVLQGVFAFDNSTSTDEITQAQVGRNCYIVDDHTVAKTSNGSTRSVAGVVIAIDAIDGVYVAISLQMSGQDTT
jgi:hypothetical protein